MTYSNK